MGLKNDLVAWWNFADGVFDNIVKEDKTGTYDLEGSWNSVGGGPVNQEYGIECRENSFAQSDSQDPNGTAGWSNNNFTFGLIFGAGHEGPIVKWKDAGNDIYKIKHDTGYSEFGLYGPAFGDGDNSIVSLDWSYPIICVFRYDQYGGADITLVDTNGTYKQNKTPVNDQYLNSGPAQYITFAPEVSGLGDPTYSGAIYHAAIWDRKLSDSEVGSYVNSGQGPTISFNSPPTASITDITNFSSGRYIYLSGSGSDPDGDSITYEIDWGDGDTTDLSSAPNEEFHNYNTSDNYTVTLTATDPDGATGSDSTTVGVFVNEYAYPESTLSVSENRGSAADLSVLLADAAGLASVEGQLVQIAPAQTENLAFTEAALQAIAAPATRQDEASVSDAAAELLVAVASAAGGAAIADTARAALRVPASRTDGCTAADLLAETLRAGATASGSPEVASSETAAAEGNASLSAAAAFADALASVAGTFSGLDDSFGASDLLNAEVRVAVEASEQANVSVADAVAAATIAAASRADSAAFADALLNIASAVGAVDDTAAAADAPASQAEAFGQVTDPATFVETAVQVASVAGAAEDAVTATEAALQVVDAAATQEGALSLLDALAEQVGAESGATSTFTATDDTFGGSAFAAAVGAAFTAGDALLQELTVPARGGGEVALGDLLSDTLLAEAGATAGADLAGAALTAVVAGESAAALAEVADAFAGGFVQEAAMAEQVAFGDEAGYALQAAAGAEGEVSAAEAVATTLVARSLQQETVDVSETAEAALRVAVGASSGATIAETPEDALSVALAIEEATAATDALSQTADLLATAAGEADVSGAAGALVAIAAALADSIRVEEQANVLRFTLPDGRTVVVDLQRRHMRTEGRERRFTALPERRAREARAEERTVSAGSEGRQLSA